MKKAELTQWQIEDAARLRALWDRYAEKNKISQAAFAEKYISSTQGMMYQYMKPTTPLNLEAAYGFSVGLGCRVFDISPTIAKRVADMLPLLGCPGLVVAKDVEEKQLLQFFRHMDEDRRLQLVGLANRFFNERQPDRRVDDSTTYPQYANRRKIEF